MHGREVDDRGRARTDRPRLTVAVLTFRRNTYLTELLPALMDQAVGCKDVGSTRVLVVDNDPQGNAATALGVEHGAGVKGTYEVLIDGESISTLVQRSPHTPNVRDTVTFWQK